MNNYFFLIQSAIALAAKSCQAMTQNKNIKTELFKQIEILGSRSLLPFSEAAIDETISQLESTNSITQPLSTNNLSILVGDWQLVYASNGTVVTRPIAEIANILGAIEVKKIWQSLAVKNGEITANNQASSEFLGEYKLSAEGIWRSQADQQTAITFNSFTAKFEASF